MNQGTTAQFRNPQSSPLVVTELKYCLYARKSTEAEDKQALSIESQVKEMLVLAEREKLNIVEIKREAHSSKEVGQRPVFNQNEVHGVALAAMPTGSLSYVMVLPPAKRMGDASTRKEPNDLEHVIS